MNSQADRDPLAQGIGRRLLLIELNEINFEVARGYVEQRGLKNLDRLLHGCARTTSSEQTYEQLEPWIQWVSAHSGMTAAEHGIFRLGDIVGSRVPQVFEELEAQGYKVGCISAMNAENRLRAPAYFIPDPWTATPSDSGFWSRALATAVSQAVNDNAGGRLTLASAMKLGLGLLRFASPRHYGLYWNLARNSSGAPWRKALFLDLFLHDLHLALYKQRQPHFSTLFLNAGAHIQHHYFHNIQGHGKQQANPSWYVDPQADPVGEMLTFYDQLLGECMALPDTDLIIATGLSQKPYDRLKYYWRLNNHADFLRMLGLSFSGVEPRMTRDFVVHCRSTDEAARLTEDLQTVRVVGTGHALFGDIDNRGDSVFVTLTHPDDVPESLEIEFAGRRWPLHQHVVFVAIKNGMHLATGYAFFHGKAADFAPAEGAHVSGLYHVIKAYFGIGGQKPLTA